MKFFTLKSLLLAVGVAVFGVSLASAQSSNSSSAASDTAVTVAVTTPPSSSPPTSVTPPIVEPVVIRPAQPLPTAIQTAIDNFSAKRDALIAARKAILDQLKNATPEQRQAIIDKLRSDAKDLIAQQRALGKEIRDQLRELRKTAPTNGGGG